MKGKSFNRKIIHFFNHECFFVTNPASIHSVGGLGLNIYNESFLRHIYIYVLSLVLRFIVEWVNFISGKLVSRLNRSSAGKRRNNF